MGVPIMIATIRTSERLSTARIARVANRTPRTAIAPTTAANMAMVSTHGAGPSSRSPSRSAMSSRLPAACDMTEIEMPR